MSSEVAAIRLCALKQNLGRKGLEPDECVWVKQEKHLRDKGHLGLRSHDGRVKFRKIGVKELP